MLPYNFCTREAQSYRDQARRFEDPSRKAIRSRNRRARHFFNDGLAPFPATSPRLSAPDREPAEVYEKERREMRQESDAKLKVPAMGNEYKKELAQEELQHREHARNVQRDRRIAKWTVVVSIVALVVAIIAIVISVH